MLRLNSALMTGSLKTKTSNQNQNQRGDWFQESNMLTTTLEEIAMRQCLVFLILP